MSSWSKREGIWRAKLFCEGESAHHSAAPGQVLGWVYGERTEFVDDRGVLLAEDIQPLATRSERARKEVDFFDRYEGYPPLDVGAGLTEREIETLELCEKVPRSIALQLAKAKLRHAGVKAGDDKC